MNRSVNTTFFFFQDSVSNAQETIDTLTGIKKLEDSTLHKFPAEGQQTIRVAPDSIKKLVQSDTVRNQNKMIVEKAPPTEVPQKKDIAKTFDINLLPAKPDTKTFAYKSENIFIPFNQKNEGFSYRPSSVFTESVHYNGLKSIMNNIPHIFQRSHLNWTLVIGFISIFLLLIIKSYYQKFLNQIVATTLNFQLADKMLREKNMIARRAFIMLNINYIMIFSLFIFLILRINEFSFTGNYTLDYFYILGLIFAVIITRYIIFYLAGYFFETIPATAEYVHNLYLVNKNLGLILLPIVFAAIYTSPGISKIILTIGAVIVGIAAIFKLFRGVMIIMKNGIFLFYSILYLCTLELLPLIIGSKIIITLR